MNTNGNTSMRTFAIIWAGQFISMIGTAMTRFAALTWSYQQTGEATTLALLGFFSFILYVLAMPFAGVLVDRFDRRRVLMLADLIAGLTTVFLFTQFASGGLQIWHLYITAALTGLCDAFHLPTYNAAISMLVPKAQYARASGLRSLGYTASQVFGPVLAGLLLPLIGFGGVLLIDVSTFLSAVGVLLFVRIPRPPVSADGEQARGTFMRELRFGFTYIFARPGLFGLLLIYTGINLAGALTYLGVLPAMVLARSGGDELALALVQASMGIGGVVGGVVVTAWRGPRRRVHGVLLGAALSFFFGDFLLAVGRTPLVWAFAGFVAAAFIPAIIAYYRTIWQTKVAPDVQGRVFAVQSALQEATLPLGYLLAGPLADRVFTPAMQPDGALAGVFGWLVGTGDGAGMGLMFIGTCVMGTLISLSGYLIPAVRRVELDLPDHDTTVPAEAEAVFAVMPAAPTACPDIL